MAEPKMLSVKGFEVSRNSVVFKRSTTGEPLNFAYIYNTDLTFSVNLINITSGKSKCVASYYNKDGGRTLYILFKRIYENAINIFYFQGVFSETQNLYTIGSEYDLTTATFMGVLPATIDTYEDYNWSVSFAQTTETYLTKYECEIMLILHVNPPPNVGHVTVGWSQWMYDHGYHQQYVIAFARADQTTWYNYWGLTPPTYEESVSSGGDGGFYLPSEDVGDNERQTISTTLCNSLGVYAMSATRLQRFRQWLYDPLSWTNPSSILVALSNPFDNIVNLNYIPVDLAKDGNSNISLGFFESEITATKIEEDYVNLDCGTMDMYFLTYYDNFVDLGAKLKLYLPFVGFVNIPTNDIYKGRLQVFYKINVVTGDALCSLIAYNYNGIKKIVNTYNCNIAIRQPLKATDFSGMLDTVKNIATHAIEEKPLAMVEDIAELNTHTESSCNLSQNTGYMADLKPYLLIDIANVQKPSNYDDLEGVESFVYDKISNCTNFIKFIDINKNTLPNTAIKWEQDEIERLLKEGIYT